jgi:hypothetical protein
MQSFMTALAATAGGVAGLLLIALAMYVLIWVLGRIHVKS